MYYGQVIVLSSLILATLCAGTSHGEDWPQFLGPNRNGVSKETTALVDSFGATGPKIVWRVAGGVGMSGVAVVDGNCLTLANRDGQQTLLNLDRTTGKERWTTPIAPAFKNQMGDGPRATPTVRGNRVFTFTGEGILTCNDLANGQILWQRNLIQELGAKPSEYGMSCSPLVVEELVVAQVGADQATVLAVNAASGKTVWTAGSGRAGYSSPALLTVAGEPQVIVFTGSQCLGIEPKGGKVLWEYPYATDFDCNVATPVAIDDKVLISSGENHGSVLLEIEPSDSRFAVKEAWRSQGTASALRSEWQTPVVVGGLVFGFDNVGGAGPVTNLACLEASSGKIVWKQMRFGKSNGILADGKLIISTMEGELVLVRATGDSFQELARAQVIGKTRQAPAYSDGFVFLRDDEHILCIDLRKQ